MSCRGEGDYIPVITRESRYSFVAPEHSTNSRFQNCPLERVNLVGDDVRAIRLCARAKRLEAAS